MIAKQTLAPGASQGTNEVLATLKSFKGAFRTVGVKTLVLEYARLQRA